MSASETQRARLCQFMQMHLEVTFSYWPSTYIFDQSAFLRLQSLSLVGDYCFARSEQRKEIMVYWPTSIIIIFSKCQRDSQTYFHFFHCTATADGVPDQKRSREAETSPLDQDSGRQKQSELRQPEEIMEEVAMSSVTENSTDQMNDI